MAKNRDVGKYEYRVKRMSAPPAGGEDRGGEYRIDKLKFGGVWEDTYTVTYRQKQNEEGEWEWNVWCSCPGIRRQKYPKELHKHVIMVRKFRETGEPVPWYCTLDEENNVRPRGDA